MVPVPGDDDVAEEPETDGACGSHKALCRFDIGIGGPEQAGRVVVRDGKRSGVAAQNSVQNFPHGRRGGVGGTLCDDDRPQHVVPRIAGNDEDAFTRPRSKIQLGNRGDICRAANHRCYRADRRAPRELERSGDDLDRARRQLQHARKFVGLAYR
jgi:hypothetical protein